MARKKRKDVSIGNKFHYLALAFDEMYVLRPNAKYHTDLIGIACQFSSRPKLKRSDFDGLLNFTINDIIKLQTNKL